MHISMLMGRWLEGLGGFGRQSRRYPPKPIHGQPTHSFSPFALVYVQQQYTQTGMGTLARSEHNTPHRTSCAR